MFTLIIMNSHLLPVFIPNVNVWSVGVGCRTGMCSAREGTEWGLRNEGLLVRFLHLHATTVRSGYVFIIVVMYISHPVACCVWSSHS